MDEFLQGTLYYCIWNKVILILSDERMSAITNINCLYKVTR